MLLARSLDHGLNVDWSKFLFLLMTTLVDVTTSTISVLGQEEGYTVKYTPLPEGVPEGKARGNS